MPVTFSLPTVLAKLADGNQTIDATGATLGDVVADIAGRFPRLAPRLRFRRLLVPGERRAIPELRHREHFAHFPDCRTATPLIIGCVLRSCHMRGHAVHSFS